MRKAPRILLLSVTVPMLSVVPVLSKPAAQPQPVTPQVRHVALAGVDAPALRAQGAQSRDASAAARADLVGPGSRGPVPNRPAVLTAPTSSDSFELMGVTWRAGSAAEVTVLVRAHTDQAWTDWTALEVADTPDATEGATRAGTEPLYVGPSDGYQVRVDVRAGRLPADLRVDLVDPGDSPADDEVGRAAPAATATAAVTRPTIYSRSDWGADERLRSGSPSYNATIKAGFVHHTAGANGYASAEVPKIIRGIYAFHTQGNGWSDIGYNFLVDRFGRIWEGRYGGVSRAVVGAHAGGFNVNTFGVSAIGNFDSAAAPDAMVDAIGRLMAWKLSIYYRNPLGTTVLTSTGGGTSRYPAGTRVRLDVVSGHRDTGYTACPGRHLYSRMGAIRNKVEQYMGASLIAPSISRTSTPYDGTPITVRAAVLRAQSWQLEIRERCRAAVVRTLSGSASPGAPIAAEWNLRGSGGSPVRPGVYDLHLTSWDAYGSARSWSRAVTVTATAANPTAPAKVALPGATAYVPLAPERLYDSRTGARHPLGPGGRLDLKVLGAGGVPASGVGAVALNVTATCATDSTAVTVWPAGAGRPGGGAVRVGPAGERTALAVSAVGGDGRVSLYNSVGITHVLVDVVGYYPTDTADGLRFHPTVPFRLFDSREGGGAQLRDGESRTLTMPSIAGVPASAMGAAVVNLTALGGEGDGVVTVNPGDATPPGTSSLSRVGVAPVKNRTVARLYSGRFGMQNTGSPTHVTVDVVGYYAPASTAGGGDLYRAVASTRVLDTRSGLGVRKGTVASGRSVNLVVAGSGKPVPTGASAVVMSVTANGANRRTYVTVWPTLAARPAFSDVVTEAGAIENNLVLVPIGSGGRISLYGAGGATHLVGDVVGYYR